MNSILLFDDHARYLEKWLHATRGTLLAALTGASFNAAQAHSNILAMVDRLLAAQRGRPVEIVELSASAAVREVAEKLAADHLVRRIAPETFLLGFKLMKSCTLEMIMESELDDREALCREGGKVFEAMEHALTGVYHKMAVTELQEKLLAKIEQAQAPKRELHLIAAGQVGKAGQLLELTQAEYAVCKLIADGLSTKVLAGRLHIAESTVHTHRKRIRAKLGLPAGQNLYVHLKGFSF